MLSALLLGLTVFSPAASAWAQAGNWGKPDPIIIDIANTEQETNYWCWPALVQQIINWRGMGRGPSQCEIVNITNAYKGWQGINCCDNPSLKECSRLGEAAEIKNLISLYGGRAMDIDVPTTPEEIYSYLMAKQVLLVGVEISGTNNKHLYMIRGLAWEGEEAILTINDPAVGQSQTLKFSEAQNTWFYALAVQ